MSVCAALLFFGMAGLRGGQAEAQSLGDVVRASRTQLNGTAGGVGPIGNVGSDTIRGTVQGTGAVAHALFGSTEFRADSLDGLPQWARVLDGMERDRPTFERCAEDAIHCTTSTLRNWRKVITWAAKLDRGDRIRVVNEFFNRWPYKQDQEVYGLREYWATPSEFMARSGDCEDYSIAKYFALRQLGFGKDELRIVILMDRIRGIAHAVLAIYQQDDILVLDSLSNLILPHDRYKHYAPQYSMNETTRWAHVGGFDKEPKTPYKGLVARKN